MGNPRTKGAARRRRRLAGLKSWRTRSARKRVGWKRDKRGHRVAALVARAYRKRVSPPRYLRRKGVGPRAYARFRARHPAPKGARAKRRKYPPTVHKYGRRRFAFNAWPDDARGHRKAAKKGWRRRKRRASRRGRSWQSLVKRLGVMEAARRWRQGRRRPKYAANPLLPMEYMPNDPRRSRMARRKRGTARRRSRARRNPLYRSSRGKYSRAKRTGYRRLRRISGGGWRNNAPRRRRRKARRNAFAGGRTAHSRAALNVRRRRGGRRSYRRNSILPIPFEGNPFEGNQDVLAAVTAPFEKMVDTGFIMGTALPTVGGFAAAHIVAYQGSKLLGVDYVGIPKHLSRLVATGLVSAVGGLVFRSGSVAANILVGGLVATLSGVVEDILGSDYTSLGVPAEAGGLMGQDDEDEMNDLIKQAVQAQMEEGNLDDYATAQAIGAAPHLSDYLTEQQLAASPQLAGGGMGSVAHFSQVVDSEADNALV